jgi:hypothetical protein
MIVTTISIQNLGIIIITNPQGFMMLEKQVTLQKPPKNKTKQETRENIQSP